MSTVPSNTQFIGFSENVNLTERRSASINSETAAYTMEDIKGYKVYTALLTQIGVHNFAFLTNAPLTLGVTYLIAHNSLHNADFTNVGAPNNDIGTSFVATGTTPNSWGTGTVDLKYDTGAPVVTVLENTLGNVWFTYGGAEGGPGCYGVNSNNLFNDKTIIFAGNKTGSWDALTSISSVNYSNSSFDLITVAGTNNKIDDVLNNTPIEIRVYN